MSLGPFDRPPRGSMTWDRVVLQIHLRRLLNLYRRNCLRLLMRFRLWRYL